MLGEANFSDHGANRLGASALMQGLADGYFVIPYTISDYLAQTKFERVTEDHPEIQKATSAVHAQIERLLSIKGTRTVDSIHRDLGKLMWEYCGMARSAESLKHALQEIPKIREAFWHDLKVVGDDEELNQGLERAGRVADFLELAELIAVDALDREESCGAHFRVEYQTPDGEAQRNDAEFCYVSAWEYKGPDQPPELHKEPLEFESIHLAQRSYK